MKNLLLGGAICLLSLAVQPDASAAGPLATLGDKQAQSYAASSPWHGQHYYLQYGQPTALVVPPNAIMQSNYSWGVCQNTMTPTYHQFGPAAMPSSGGVFYATPHWPSHSRQLGIYPVRAPW